MWTRQARYLFSKANKEAITMDAKSLKGVILGFAGSGSCHWISPVLPVAPVDNTIIIVHHVVRDH